VDVLALTRQAQDYLTGVLQMFSDQDDARETDLLQDCMSAIKIWRATIPEQVRGSRHLSVAARGFDRNLVSADPPSLLLEKLPRLVGTDLSDSQALLTGVQRLKSELEGVADVVRDDVVLMISNALAHRGIEAERPVNGHSLPLPCLLAQASRWASCFPKAVADRIRDSVARAALSRLKAPYQDDHTLANALAVLLVGRWLNEWDETLTGAFLTRLDGALNTIEEAATELLRQPEASSEVRNGLAQIAMARAQTAADQLANIVGYDVAAERLKAIASEIRNHSCTGSGLR